MSPSPRIFVAGHRGLVGAALVRRLERTPATVLTRSHQELDLTRQEAVEQFFREERPEVVYLAAAKVDAAVSVQARTTIEETDWLLDLAGENDFIAGVVGWVELTDGRVGETLGRLAAREKLVAVRHVLQCSQRFSLKI